MIKRYLTALLILLTVCSCNDSAGKKDEEGAAAGDKKYKGERNDRLIYLDTAVNMYNLLCQEWVIADDADALAGMEEDSKFEIAHRSFYFAANGTFVKNPRNAIDYGRWEYDDKQKTITVHYSVEKGKDVYKIAALAPDELKLLNTGINTSTILEFVSRGVRLKDAAEEPFDLLNNRWRIRPDKKESDPAIHQRLKENLRFFILYYKSVITKADPEVSFWGLPSCFKWYGGGIYLKKKEELKENWIRCFYDRDQAMQAYALAGKLLEKKYTWPKGESSWLKQNLAVLEQMYKNMDEIQ